jgi:hypothetical protein
MMVCPAVPQILDLPANLKESQKWSATLHGMHSEDHQITGSDPSLQGVFISGQFPKRESDFMVKSPRIILGLWTAAPHLLALLRGHGLELLVAVDDGEQVHVLALVFVDALDLDVKHGVQVHVLTKVLRTTQITAQCLLLLKMKCCTANTERSVAELPRMQFLKAAGGSLSLPDSSFHSGSQPGHCIAPLKPANPKIKTPLPTSLMSAAIYFFCYTTIHFSTIHSPGSCTPPPPKI